MAECNLKASDALIVQGDLHMQSGSEAMVRLLAYPKPPTAVFCTNEIMALGALQAAINWGVDVPGDLSIIGFDNLPVCDLLRPRLTSVDIPRREIAVHAFDLLLKITQSPTVKHSTPCIKTQLVVRESTGARLLSRSARSIRPPR
jgi:DNA-binding LacI/PurR family transcriptional regulator